MPENDGQTPTAWLWEEIGRRYGAAAAEELRQGFNQRQRSYSKHRQKVNTQWHAELGERMQARHLAEEEAAQELEREIAEAQRPWVQILLIPGEGKWAPILPGTVRDTFPHTMLQQDGTNWLLSLPPGRPLSEQDERYLKSLKDQEILKDWQVLLQEEQQGNGVEPA
jgi:hypothetical protein